MSLGKSVRLAGLSMMKWGDQVQFGDFVHMDATGKKGLTIGNNAAIGAFSTITISPSLKKTGVLISIGNNVSIGEYACIKGPGKVVIGDDCMLGPYFSCQAGSQLYNAPFVPIRLQAEIAVGVTIGNNCLIGSKVTILDGVSIGNGCVVAAGSVVNKSYPENSVIGGAPANLIKKRGKKTLFELMDLEYELTGMQSEGV